MNRRSIMALGLWALCLLAAACAPVAAPAVVVPEPPPVTWEDKLGWMMRLEDQRILRDPNPPARAVLAPATLDRPQVLGPPAPSDLLELLKDPEGRVRRRAALAAGRVGLSEAVEPLTTLLSDPEVEIRQMAVFALGLIGDAAARPVLLGALKDAEPIVQGRAAEALGMIANLAGTAPATDAGRSDAAAVAEMIRVHVAAGALNGLEPDDLTYPLAPSVEAVRLGLYALVRLGSYDALAAAALDASGQPVSTWWPVAYALQRLGDPRAAPALTRLLETPGRYTAAFAARGLGTTKATQAAAALRSLVDARRAPEAVVVQAIRALALMGDSGAEPVLTRVVTTAAAGLTIRTEAMAALVPIAGAGSVDLMLELISDPTPAIRGGAIRILARVDPDAFLAALSGLDVDRDWTVRAAQATALGTLPERRGVPRLLDMLADGDVRLVPGVLAALVAARAPEAQQVLLERLKADDFVTRAAAANGLAELKVPAAVPALVAAFRANDGDSTYVARAAILSALAQLDRTAARPLLQEALTARDWALRVRAAALLREQGVTDNVETSIRPAPSGRVIPGEEWQALLAPPFSPHAFIETDRGTIEIELAILDAPLTVANFMTLARRGFFNGTAIHRVVADFVVQDGDPRGDGEGGPGFTIRDEMNQRPYLRGTVGMALDWEDTGGSQFFITHSPQPHLDGRYTVFGHVVSGMEVVDAIQPWDVIRQVRIRDGVND
jgi:cyclophilin family peptidyl-prolyl cis-trans isomerase/HEAT repeat protein